MGRLWILINHLHGDHTTDLIQVYGFGDGGDRKSPLYIWSHGPSGVLNPGPNSTGPNPANPTASGGPPTNAYASDPPYYNDGVGAFCTYLREACRWHTESQAFQGTAYQSYKPLAQIAADWGLPYEPTPAGIYPDPPNDANALIPIELDWTKTGLDENGRPTGDNIAYNNSAIPQEQVHSDMYAPKYHYDDGSGNPFYQIEMDTSIVLGIPPTQQGGSNGQPTYNESGY